MSVVLIGMEAVLSFALEPVTYQHTLEQEMKGLEMRGVTPNIVVLGDSTALYGLAPVNMEETLGDQFCVLNAATASQQVWGSYYYLKDLLQKYEKIRYVVLGIDYWAYAETDISIKKELLILDRIKDPKIKLEYVGNIFKPEEYPYLMKSYANRDQIGNMGNNLRQKLSWGYLFGNKNDVSQSEMTRGHSVIGPGMGAKSVGIQELGEFEMADMDPMALEYLDKIRKLCVQKGVKLYLMGMPLTSATVYASESYDGFYAYFHDYAKQHQIQYWDFNLLKDRFEVMPDELMADIGHPGAPGYQQLSRKLGTLLRKDMAGKSVEYEFYSNVSMWRKSLSGIIGCDLYTESIAGTKDRTLNGFSLAADGIEVEYEFWISVDGKNGNWIKLQEYGKGKECIVPGKYFEEDLWMKVCCRQKGRTSSYEKCCVRMRSSDM